jgi:ABC-type transporter Mla MlaB component
MLRITKLRNGNSEVVKLEGALRAPWLEEVRDALIEAKRQQLDLADVTFADDAGIKLLRELLNNGVEISRCSGFVAASLGMETT